MTIITQIGTYLPKLKTNIPLTLYPPQTLHISLSTISLLFIAKFLKRTIWFWYPTLPPSYSTFFNLVFIPSTYSTQIDLVSNNLHGAKSNCQFLKQHLIRDHAFHPKTLFSLGYGAIIFSWSPRISAASPHSPLLVSPRLPRTYDSLSSILTPQVTSYTDNSWICIFNLDLSPKLQT